MKFYEMKINGHPWWCHTPSDRRRCFKYLSQHMTVMGKWCPRCRAGPGRCSCPWW